MGVRTSQITDNSTVDTLFLVTMNKLLLNGLLFRITRKKILKLSLRLPCAENLSVSDTDCSIKVQGPEIYSLDFFSIVGMGKFGKLVGETIILFSNGIRYFKTVNRFCRFCIR